MPPARIERRTRLRKRRGEHGGGVLAACEIGTFESTLLLSKVENYPLEISTRTGSVLRSYSSPLL